MGSDSGWGGGSRSVGGLHQTEVQLPPLRGHCWLREEEEEEEEEEETARERIQRK